VEIVDNLNRNGRVFILHQSSMPVYHKVDRSPGARLPSSVSSMRYAKGETAPGWWFHGFEPVWKPFIQRLCRQKKVTLFEFEQAASQVPGLTHIEKTIAISAFRQQQEDELPSSHNTTPFPRERNLSAV